MALCDITVSRNAFGKTYDNVDSIPHRKIGLILGTSPVSTWNGRRNYYFHHIQDSLLNSLFCVNL